MARSRLYFINKRRSNRSVRSDRDEGIKSRIRHLARVVSSQLSINTLTARQVHQPGQWARKPRTGNYYRVSFQTKSLAEAQINISSKTAMSNHIRRPVRKSAGHINDHSRSEADLRSIDQRKWSNGKHTNKQKCRRVSNAAEGLMCGWYCVRDNKADSHTLPRFGATPS